MSLRLDARELVVKIITGDKAKTQTYCQIADLIDQLAETTVEGKTDELLQKITVLVASLPEYATLVRDLQGTRHQPEIPRRAGDRFGTHRARQVV